MVKKLLSTLLVSVMALLMMTTVVPAEGDTNDLTAFIEAVNNAGNAYELRAAIQASGLGLDLTKFSVLSRDPRNRVLVSMLYERPIGGFTDKADLQACLDSVIARTANMGENEVLPEPAPGASLPADPDFFPIAVWLQDPFRVYEHQSIGVNTFVGLWDGLNQRALDFFHETGIRVICEMNEFAVEYLKTNPDDPAIIGWSQQDEPDNAQDLSSSSNWGPPIDPGSVIVRYNQIKAIDPNRPVFLNLGQGVAWKYGGRGIDTGKDFMYPQYIKGSDIVCFDVYPANSTDQAVRNNLPLVAKGIDNLRAWSNDEKPAWAWIETGSINGSGLRPTPEQIKAEVWMAIIHGAKGIGYFLHEFSPQFYENGLLDPANAENKAMVAAVNAQITELAPVLNCVTINGYAAVESSNNVPIDIMTKEYNGARYIFSVGMANNAATASFSVASGDIVKVIGEDRKIDIVDGKFTDEFDPYGVHLYKVMDTAELSGLFNHAYESGKIDNEGVLNSLLAKSEKVLEYRVETIYSKDLYNALKALNNELKAQSGKHINAEFADDAIELVQELMQTISAE